MNTNLPQVLGFQLPDFLRGVAPLGPDAALSTGEGALPLPRIVLSGKQFQVRNPDGASRRLDITVSNAGRPMTLPAPALSFAIVGVVTPNGRSRRFFSSSYQEDSPQGPDCESKGGVVPDARAMAPQAARCTACPKNAWESAVDANGNPTKGKACTEYFRLVGEEVGAFGIGSPFILDVTPGSLRNLSEYGLLLKRIGARFDFGTIHTVEFDDRAAYPVLRWLAPQPISEGLYSRVQAAQADPLVREVLQGTLVGDVQRIPQEVAIQTPQEVAIQTPQEVAIQIPQEVAIQTPQEVAIQTPQEVAIQTPPEAISKRKGRPPAIGKAPKEAPAVAIQTPRAKLLELAPLLQGNPGAMQSPMVQGLIAQLTPQELSEMLGLLGIQGAEEKLDPSQLPPDDKAVVTWWNDSRRDSPAFCTQANLERFVRADLHRYCSV